MVIFGGSNCIGDLIRFGSLNQTFAYSPNREYRHTFVVSFACQGDRPSECPIGPSYQFKGHVYIPLLGEQFNPKIRKTAPGLEDILWAGYLEYVICVQYHNSIVASNS